MWRIIFGYGFMTWLAGIAALFVILALLDPVSARGRAKVLSGFNYIWEVYKLEHQRKYSYYTLPVLWGDRLVARFDSKLDAKAIHEPLLRQRVSAIKVVDLR